MVSSNPSALTIHINSKGQEAWMNAVKPFF